MTIKQGHFGRHGGRFVPDTLYAAVHSLESLYNRVKRDKKFQSELDFLLKHYVGRPSPLYFAESISDELNLKIYLKREDLNHTGAHKINNTLGQVLLAQYMGKKRIIAETGAGQHGVATATVCALKNLECVVYMGAEDIKRQSFNVYRMKLLGATVVSVESGAKTLKDATSEAFRDYMKNVENSHYIIGSVLGPHPYPTIVRDFQSVIGKETKKQLKAYHHEKPDYIMACVGGGSNAMGIFYPFLKDKKVTLVAVEAAESASLANGESGILHGSLNYILQDQNGQIKEAHSIAAGLDYPGVSPELCELKDAGRLDIASVTDKEAIEACKWLSRREGIIPALETSHVLAELKKNKRFEKGSVVVVNISGRGDKDMGTLMAYDR
jgi:tryptophan synthase beta chain